MFSFFGLPGDVKGTLQEYTITGNTSSGPSWQLWEKPKKSGFTHIFAVGAGGGGGSGNSGATGVGKTGGGGGGGGGTVSLVIPTVLLPDTLYIQIGRGGAGATTPGGVAGSPGTTTYVCIFPLTTSNQYILFSISGGFGGISTGGFTGGGVPTLSIAATAALYSSSTGNSPNPPQGGNGPSNTGLFNNRNMPINGGCAGSSVFGTTDYDGGRYIADSFWPQTLPVGGAAGGGDGTSGVVLRPPLFPFTVLGGTGGGTNYAGTGGKGGDATIMGGGGGGGGSGLTGGLGGKGADGYLAILSI